MENHLLSGWTFMIIKLAQYLADLVSTISAIFFFFFFGKHILTQDCKKILPTSLWYLTRDNLCYKMLWGYCLLDHSELRVVRCHDGKLSCQFFPYVLRDLKCCVCHIKFPVGNYNKPKLCLLGFPKENNMLVVCGIFSY